MSKVYKNAFPNPFKAWYYMTVSFDMSVPGAPGPYRVLTNVCGIEPSECVCSVTRVRRACQGRHQLLEVKGQGVALPPAARGQLATGRIHRYVE